jgi:hypothetical protein
MVNVLYAMIDKITLHSDRAGHSNAAAMQREVEQ